MNWEQVLSVSKDYDVIVMFISLLCFALARFKNSELFDKFLQLPLNPNFLVRSARLGYFKNSFQWFLLLFQVLNLGLFLFNAGAYLALSPQYVTYWKPINISLGIGLFFLLKAILQWFVGLLFKRKTPAMELLFDKHTHQNYGTIFLFMANILTGFVVRNELWVPVLFGFLYLLILLQGWLLILRREQKGIILRPHYFILYLCALEFAPIFFLIKQLKG